MPRHSAITIADVARLSQVSVATVSFVLNNTKPVTPEVRARVEAAVRSLGYQPSHAAKALRTGKTNTLGLIIPDLTNPFFPKLAQDIETVAARAGFAVLLADSHDDPNRQAEALHTLERRGVDVILIVPAVGTKGSLHTGVPLIALDRPAGDSLLVRSDEALGGQQAATHLLELGHARFAILAGPKRASQPGARVHGMIAAIERAGLRVPEQHLYFSEYSLEAGREGVGYLLGRGQDFTALLAANDTLALGALSALQAAGLRVPTDLSLVGFDDIPWASLSSPPLTTVRQNTAELAHQALELALGRHPAASVVATELIVRASSAAPQATPGRYRKGRR